MAAGLLPDGLTGVDRELEFEADKILSWDKSRAEVKSTDWYGILSPDQVRARLDREVYNQNGFPEPAIEEGLYRRAYNPLFGKRPKGRRTWPDLEYDARVGIAGNHRGYPDYTPRDPAGVVLPRDGYYWHLDRYQRSRIRSVMRKLPPHRQDARKVVKAILAEKYGVPTWVIARCLA